MSAVISFRAAAPAIPDPSSAGAAPPAGAGHPIAAAQPSHAARPAAFEVPVGRLAPDPEQPRSVFSEEQLGSLAVSIRACGVIQPLLVRDHPDPTARTATPYMLIVGERRWTAARRAGLATVPVVLFTTPLSPPDRLMMQIAENDGELHENLPLHDLAAAVARAFQVAGLSRRDFAHRHGRSLSWLAFLLRLAAARGLTREALREGHLRGILAAHTFLKLSNPQRRRLIAEARRTGVPITLRRARQAAEWTERRRCRPAAAGRPIAAAPEAPGSAAAGRGAPGCPTAATPEAAQSPASLAVPAAAPAAGTAPSPVLCHRCGGAASEPSVRRPGPAHRLVSRGQRLHLLPAPPPPVALRRARFDGPWIALEITRQQLETLVVLVGKQPAPSPRAQVEQLMACL